MRERFRRRWFCILSCLGFGTLSWLLSPGSFAAAHAQSLKLPSRPVDARTGSEVAKALTDLPGPNVRDARKLSARETAIRDEILKGNVPDWLRQLVPVTTNATINGTNFTLQYHVTPDYLAIGSNNDYFLTPMTPLLGQHLADALHCTLPTAKMVNNIWSQAPCKLSPSPIPPSPAMATVPVFIDHNETVRAQRFAVTNKFPLGTLTAGHKKDVVISGRIHTNFARASVTNSVVIYGWHQPNGSPIQNVYNGHGETYADYSHGIRLVQMDVTVNGKPDTVTNILQHPRLAPLLSDDPYYESNAIPNPRYPKVR